MDQYLQDRDEGLLEGMKISDAKVTNAYKAMVRSRRKVSIPIERLLDPTSAKDHKVPDSHSLNLEILMLLGGGNDSTSNAMIFGVYYICKYTEVQKRLEEELRAAYPIPGQPISYATVKQLPYLVKDPSSYRREYI